MCMVELFFFVNMIQDWKVMPQHMGDNLLYIFYDVDFKLQAIFTAKHHLQS